MTEGPSMAVMSQSDGSTSVTRELVERVLGPPRYNGNEAAERITAPGTVAGLVWTAAGGRVQYIECARIGYGRPDRPGSLTLTGQVGEVLEESARIALSWIRSHAYELGLEPSPQSIKPAAQYQPHPQSYPVIRSSPEPLTSHEALEDEASSRLPLRALSAIYHKDPTHEMGMNDEAAAGMLQGLGSFYASTRHEIVNLGTRGGMVRDGASGSGEWEQESSFALPAATWDIHIHLPAGEPCWLLKCCSPLTHYRYASTALNPP